MSGALIYETQTLLMVGSAADVFSLTFRGAESAAITLGTDKYEDLPGILEALGTVSASGVAVSAVDNLGADVPTTDVFAADDVVTIKFTLELGDLPLLVSSNTAAAQVSAGTNGKTPYRKEIQTFTCQITGAGSFTVTYADQTTTAIADTADIPTFKADLEKLSSIPSPNGVTVYDAAGATTGGVCSNAGKKIYVRFERLHGDIDDMVFAPTGVVIGSIGTSAVSGITVVTGSMSGSFQVSYTCDNSCETTGVLNAGTDAIGMRDALESLASINTADVTRDWSKKQVTGSSLKVSQGAQYAECGGGACNFRGAVYIRCPWGPSFHRWHMVPCVRI